MCINLLNLNCPTDTYIRIKDNIMIIWVPRWDRVGLA